jgi:hypothetical protein
MDTFGLVKKTISWNLSETFCSIFFYQEENHPYHPDSHLITTMAFQAASSVSKFSGKDSTFYVIKVTTQIFSFARLKFKALEALKTGDV